MPARASALGDHVRGVNRTHETEQRNDYQFCDHRFTSSTADAVWSIVSGPFFDGKLASGIEEDQRFSGRPPGRC
jgi:hypothetical protein